MKEMNLPPAEFQDYLTYIGGINKFDSPNFILWWNQYAYGEGSFRSGGVWSVEEQHFEGYRDLLKGSGEPCWCLGQYHSADEYGTPESFYFDNRDEATGLQILGEFPFAGKYELLYNLRWHSIENGKIEFFTLPLSTHTFDLIVPVIIAAKNVSIEKRRAAYLDAKQKEEDAKLTEIERKLREKDIPFKGAISYGRQGIRSTVVDQKMLQMSQTWGEVAKAAKTLRKGLQTR
jgi:hypothetical protein